MEKLINSIPKEDTYKQTNGEVIHQGFFLRYRPLLEKWACGYGSRTPSPKKLGKTYVLANDPVEAVADFVELLNKK